MIEFEYSALTDVGQVRTNNEDAVGVDAARGIVVLADGMGGYSAGEVASAMAVDHVLSALRLRLDAAGSGAGAQIVQRAMQESVDEANRAILDAANARPECRGMGTTLLMAVLSPEAVVIGHIGDSRAYRWRAGRLTQLTRDHSLFQERVDLGLLTRQQTYRLEGYRNLLTRAVGVEETALLDTQVVDLQPRDTFLFCSDGLTTMLADENIALHLYLEDPVEAQARALIVAANDAGGRDNVSVILARAQNVPAPARQPPDAP